MQKFNYENFIKYSTFILLLLLIWGSIWSLKGEEAVPPNGYLFNLLVVFITSYLSGEVTKLIHLPPLLGMLITGFVIGNAFDINLNKNYSSIIRSVGLVIILLRAGLELDPKAILKLSAVCVRLSVIPLIVEAVVTAAVTYLLLDFPIVWGLLLGFVLGAATPAVVMPGLIAMQERGYGTDKGVPTLVIAAASVDDVLAITGFGLCLGFVFGSDSSLIWNIFKGPVEALAGVGFGIIVGLIFWFIPMKEESNNQRILFLLLSGIFALFGSEAVKMDGAGPLACLVTSFVAAFKWRKTPKINESLQQNLNTFWIISEPFLFALIGTDVKLSDMKADEIGWAFIALTIGLIIRTLSVILIVFGAQLNFKEKFFVGLAWLPKATVQAAIGPIALDMAREKGDINGIKLGNSVLTIAVLSIIMTAPIGAIFISLLGPKFLTKNSTKMGQNLEEIEPKIEDNQQMTESISQ